MEPKTITIKVPAFLSRPFGRNWITTLMGIIMFTVAEILQNQATIQKLMPNKYASTLAQVFLIAGLIKSIATKDAGRKTADVPASSVIINPTDPLPPVGGAS